MGDSNENLQHLKYAAASYANHNLSSLAAKFDDFYDKFSPRLEDTENETDNDKSTYDRNIFRALLEMCLINSTQPAQSDILYSNRPVEAKLDKIFHMQSQHEEVCLNEKADLEAINNEIARIDEIINVTESALNETLNEADINIIGLKKDFVKHRKLLYEVIGTVYNEKAEEILFILHELFQNHFNDNEAYVNSKNFSKFAVEDLNSIGLLDFDPNNSSNIKLINLNN